MSGAAVKLEPDRTAIELSNENVGFEINFRLPCDDPYVKYVTRFSGVATLDDVELDQPVTLCRIDGHRIDLQSATANGLDVGELLESLNAELADLSQILFAADGSGQLRIAVGKYPIGSRCNLVYIDRLQVRAEARSLGIGRRMLCHVARVVDIPDRLIGLKAMPLAEAFENRVDLDREARKQRLRRYYTEFGFTPLDKEYMVAEALR